MQTRLIAGRINESITFTVEDFRFTFVAADNDHYVIKADESGYIWGKTHTGKNIAILTGNDINIYHATIFNTWNYVITQLPQKEFSFDTIKFENGVLLSVSPCHAIQEDFCKEEELNRNSGNETFFVYRQHDDSKVFDVSDNNKHEKWIFTSKISRSTSIDKGDMLRNDTEALLIELEGKHVLQTFRDYYSYAVSVLAFLTFRSNISFEKITLMNEDYDIAECFVKYPETISTRSVMNVIRVNLLTENVFRNLIQCAKENTLPILIIPENDKDTYLITGDRIKNICSALELELNAADIKADKSCELENLISEVKKIIKAHRKKSTNTLPDKTYNNIFNSIGHWGDSLADRLIEAWKLHHDKFQNMLFINEIKICDDEIIEFVKTRNNITHRAFQNISRDTANTAFIMSGLVYCMVLERLGIDKNIIEAIMSSGLIG